VSASSNDYTISLQATDRKKQTTSSLKEEEKGEREIMAPGGKKKVCGNVSELFPCKKPQEQPGFPLPNNGTRGNRWLRPKKQGQSPKRKKEKKQHKTSHSQHRDTTKRREGENHVFPSGRKKRENKKGQRRRSMAGKKKKRGQCLLLPGILSGEPVKKLAFTPIFRPLGKKIELGTKVPGQQKMREEYAAKKKKKGWAIPALRP